MRRAVPFLASVVLLASALPASSDAEPPAWLAVLVDLTQGDVEVEILNRVRCASDCTMVDFSLSADGGGGGGAGVVGRRGIYVEARVPGAGLEVSKVIEPPSIPGMEQPSGGGVGLGVSGTLSQSNHGAWWAFVVIMDPHAHREVSMAFDPPDRVRILRSGMDAHLLKASDLPSEVHVRAWYLDGADAAIQGSVVTKEGFLGVFRPYDIFFGTTVGARFEGPSGQRYECAAGAPLFPALCDFNWQGMGPSGAYRYSILLKNQVLPDWPVLAYVDSPPLV